MKHLALLILIFLSTQVNASKEQFIKANLKKVKVFLKGAEITHSAQVKLENGNTDIIFYGIAQNINPNSINISVNRNLNILSVEQKVDYLKSPEKNSRIKVLEDSLKIFKKYLSIKQNNLDVLNAEIELLFANKIIGGKDKGTSINELQKFSDYFRKKLTELKYDISDLSQEIKDLQNNIDRITKQLNELNANLNKPVNEIVVTVNSKEKLEANFTISYLIDDASWSPAYDIRVDNINSPANLKYKAIIKQNSGIDWENVEVILTTRNTAISNNKPELFPWFIDFEKQFLMKDAGVSAKRIFAPQTLISEESLENAAIENFDIIQTQLTTEFIPDINYSITSDNKPHVVELKNITINTNYEYYAVPKLDNNAFLVAYLSKWNEYSLLPGEANIYFENSYVGKTYLNPYISKDTMTISLGRDQNITLSKQVIKDFTENKFLSNDIERTFAYEIKIKNNKTIPVNLIVEDQIPISKNEDIKVKLIDYDNGTYYENDGRIRWAISLKESESTTRKLIYSVRHPKDKIISNL
ncbi:DUF4139 domain-containing protein [Rosettibacter firmus]|uniref:DUF4139 domain-containing protein n=1 Tax=Rosettibacter firmus TaxID=3111522 RepID=UPI00336C14CC